jgi:hypothetical protein
LTLRQLVADIPYLKHLCVLECVTRIGLNPLFKGSPFGLSAVIFVQTHTPVSRSVEDLVFHLVRTQGAHQKLPVWLESSPYEVMREKNVKKRGDIEGSV